MSECDETEFVIERDTLGGQRGWSLTRVSVTRFINRDQVAWSTDLHDLRNKYIEENAKLRKESSKAVAAIERAIENEPPSQ